jgi:hypothetical protein
MQAAWFLGHAILGVKAHPFGELVRELLVDPVTSQK